MEPTSNSEDSFIGDIIAALQTSGEEASFFERWKDVALSLQVSSKTIASLEKGLKALKINIYEAFRIILKEWTSQHGNSSQEREKIIHTLEKHGLNFWSSRSQCVQINPCQIQNRPITNLRNTSSQVSIPLLQEPLRTNIERESVSAIKSMHSIFFICLLGLILILFTLALAGFLYLQVKILPDMSDKAVDLTDVRNRPPKMQCVDTLNDVNFFRIIDGTQREQVAKKFNCPLKEVILYNQTVVQVFFYSSEEKIEMFIKGHIDIPRMLQIISAFCHHKVLMITVKDEKFCTGSNNLFNAKLKKMVNLVEINKVILRNATNCSKLFKVFLNEVQMQNIVTLEIIDSVFAEENMFYFQKLLNFLRFYVQELVMTRTSWNKPLFSGLELTLPFTKKISFDTLGDAVSPFSSNMPLFLPNLENFRILTGYVSFQDLKTILSFKKLKHITIGIEIPEDLNYFSMKTFSNLTNLEVVTVSLKFSITTIATCRVIMNNTPSYMLQVYTNCEDLEAE